MKTTTVYWSYIGVMENEMETTLMDEIGFRGSDFLGLLDRGVLGFRVLGTIRAIWAIMY